MDKHIIFLVHGMGNHSDGWHKPIETQLVSLYSAYKPLAGLPFSDHFECVPVRYDDEFEALRDLWRKQTGALGSAIAASGVSKTAIKKLNELAGATNRSSFLNTHIVDVLLYYCLRQVASMVRDSVRNQILTALAKRSTGSPAKWSIVAHSLGTAVIHDSLHELYTDKTVSDTAVFTGVTKPTCLAMIANVSRVLEQGRDFDVYRSRVRPGTDVYAGCLFYLNARHEWDPFTQPKKFAPMSDWPSPEARARELFVDCQIRDIAEPNVHAISHYLANPLVHGPLFNCLHGAPKRLGMLSADDIATAHAHFVANLKKDAFDKALGQLKKNRLGEEAGWDEILRSWANTLK